MKRWLLFIILFFLSPVYSMDQDGKMFMVLSHGFGKTKEELNEFGIIGGSWSGPSYPDEGKLGKAVFYTKPAVHMLVDHLYEIANKQDCNGILLAGHSCGAGTAINALAKLAHYQEDVDYFNGTKIASQDDADKIMATINKGAFVIREPLLSMRKVNCIADPCSKLAYLTAIGSVVAIAYHDIVKNKRKMTSIGLQIATIVLYYAVASGWLKKLYAQAVVRWILPYKTCYNFNPHHEDPLQLIKLLHGKLTCPLLLQFNQNDVLLENPDEDTVDICNVLENGKTHIIITDDSNHGEESQQFKQALIDFNKKYYKGELVDKITRQFSINDLKDLIYSQRTNYDYIIV